MLGGGAPVGEAELGRSVGASPAGRAEHAGTQGWENHTKVCTAAERPFPGRALVSDLPEYSAVERWVEASASCVFSRLGYVGAQPGDGTGKCLFLQVLQVWCSIDED